MEVKWLNGCEMCNTGIVEEVKSLQEDGLSVRAATEVMHETAYKKYPELKDELTAKRIRARYIRQVGGTNRTVQTNINNNSELEKKIEENKKIFEEVNKITLNLGQSKGGRVEAFKAVGLKHNFTYKNVEKKYYNYSKRLKAQKETPERSIENLQKEELFWNNFPKQVEALEKSFMDCAFSPPSKGISGEKIRTAKNSIKTLMLYMNELNNN